EASTFAAASSKTHPIVSSIECKPQWRRALAKASSTCATTRGTRESSAMRVPRDRVPPRRQLSSARYANNSNYKNDTMHDQVFVSSSVLHETRRIIHESEIMKEDDSNWTGTDRIGRQELEIVMCN
ncbi:hypothetical protein EJB05_14252, partial [Eragrostis curvula]